MLDGPLLGWWHAAGGIAAGAAIADLLHTHLDHSLCRMKTMTVAARTLVKRWHAQGIETAATI